MNTIQAPTNLKPLRLNTKRDGSGVDYTIDPAKEIARGGEGWIATTSNKKLVAKIYHDHIAQRMSLIKYQDLVKLDDKTFVIPKELLYDKNGKVQGFLMDYIDINGYYPLERIYKKVFCQQEGIDNKIKTKIVKAIIKGVQEAHKLDIVIGDLNPYNILANKDGDIYFIDVDSYQTPKVKHSGIMLEEITDFLHNRRISKESDYFALSCIVFNLITLVHPFKGIHNKYKSIKDRMIHKLPLFKKGESFKIPKFYQPIGEQHLMDQFKRFYENGERALLILDAGVSFIATSPLEKPSQVAQFDEGSLSIREIVNDGLIYDVFALAGRFVIKSQNGFQIFTASNKGYVTLLKRFSKSEYDDVFIGNKTILAKKGKDLYNITTTPTRIENYEFQDGVIIKQQSNVLLVQSGEVNKMDSIEIDKTFGKFISIDQHVVNRQAMNMVGGMFHAAGGKQLIVNVNETSKVNFILAPVNVREVLQVGKVGVVKYVDDKGKILMKYYKLKGLEMQLSYGNCGDMYHVGYLAGQKNEGFIFQPQDGFIRVIRTDDFEEVSRLDCSVCTSQSFIQNTASGMIMWEDGKVMLINRK